MSKFSDNNFSGQKVLVRVDFNVPLDKQTGEITDDTRMTAAIPTIQKILKDGGSAILMSHFGRPKDGPEDKYSLKQLVSHLEGLLKGSKVHFAADCISDDASRMAKDLKPSEVKDITEFLKSLTGIPPKQTLPQLPEGGPKDPTNIGK